MHFGVESTLCNGSNGYDFAYVNVSDDGAKGKIASLLTAYALKADVYLANTVTDANGYCQIGEIEI